MSKESSKGNRMQRELVNQFKSHMETKPVIHLKFNKDKIDVVFHSHTIDIPTITYYNISNRTYTKRNTDNEISFNKWLFKYKAKFIPNL